MPSPTKKPEALSTTKLEGPVAINLALDAAERGQSTVLSLVQDARAELRVAADSTIDLAEKLAAGSVRLTRKVVQKVDELASDALKGTERALHEAIENARETARAGRELAERAVEKVTGQSSAA